MWFNPEVLAKQIQPSKQVWFQRYWTETDTGYQVWSANLEKYANTFWCTGQVSPQTSDK